MLFSIFYKKYHYRRCQQSQMKKFWTARETNQIIRTSQQRYPNIEFSRVTATRLKPRPNDRNMPTQHVATLLGATCCVRLATVLRHVGSSLKLVKFAPTTANMSQHVATWWPNERNMLRPTMLRHVALVCCDRLARA